VSPSLILLVGMASHGWTAPLPAKTLLERAQLQAAKENKNVYVMFMTSRNEWCQKHEDFVARYPDFYRRNFVTVRLTLFETPDRKHLENEGSPGYLTKWSGQQPGLPFFAILNPKGEMVGNSMFTQAGKTINLGHPWVDEEVDAYMKLLEKGTHASKAELTEVKAKLQAQKGRHAHTLVL
jgi:hypothetical protein